jgi:hypothetical protein
MYSCEAAAPGTAANCIGGPTLDPHPQLDPDKNFPAGCEAILPYCVTFSDGVECDCGGPDGTEGSGWVCLL